MTLPLIRTLLIATVLTCSCSSTTSTSAGRYTLRVDRTFDRSAQPTLPREELPAEHYRVTAPADRWEVTLEGATVVLTAIGKAERVEGKEVHAAPGERRFDLDKGTFAGGRFLVRGEEAELTVFGSGVPVVSSERGKLVPR